MPTPEGPRPQKTERVIETETTDLVVSSVAQETKGNIKEAAESEVRSNDYEFFTQPEERQELFNYSKAIAEYLRTEGVTNLVLIDRSARPLYISVKEYLRSQYPDEEMPNIYFFNPKGFKAKEDLTQRDKEELRYDRISGDDIREGAFQARSQEDITREFQDTYKKLIASKDQAILIFDSCIHKGGSLAPVKKVLEEAGFSDVRIGSVTPSDFGSKVKSDFSITKQTPKKKCDPFGDDRIIGKTFEHVYSRRTTDPQKREQSIRLRKEIKQIMKEYLEEKKEE